MHQKSFGGSTRPGAVGVAYTSPPGTRWVWGGTVALKRGGGIAEGRGEGTEKEERDGDGDCAVLNFLWKYPVSVRYVGSRFRRRKWRR